MSRILENSYKEYECIERRERVIVCILKKNGNQGGEGILSAEVYS